MFWKPRAQILQARMRTDEVSYVSTTDAKKHKKTHQKNPWEEAETS